MSASPTAPGTNKDADASASLTGNAAAGLDLPDGVRDARAARLSVTSRTALAAVSLSAGSRDVVYLRTVANGVAGAWQQLPIADASDPTNEASQGIRGTVPLIAVGATEIQAVSVGESDATLHLVSSATKPSDAKPTAIEDAASGTLSRRAWSADESLVKKAGVPASVTGAVLTGVATSGDYAPEDVPAILRALQRYQVGTLHDNDIASNVIVDRFGRAWEGRLDSLSRVRGTTAGAVSLGDANTTTLGVTVLGDFTASSPSGPVLTTTQKVLGTLFNENGVDPSGSARVQTKDARSARQPAVSTVDTKAEATKDAPIPRQRSAEQGGRPGSAAKAPANAASPQPAARASASTNDPVPSGVTARQPVVQNMTPTKQATARAAVTQDAPAVRELAATTMLSPSSGLGDASGSIVAGTSTLMATSTTSPMDGWTPGNIISDASFYDGGALSAADVQGFINNQGVNCVNNPNDGTPCLKNFRTNTPSVAANAECTAIPAMTNATAGDIIAAVGAACGVSQKAMLATLQKESSLVDFSSTDLTPRGYATAFGAGCPDFTTCDSSMANFFNQAYGSASHFKEYKVRPNDWSYVPGPVQMQYNPETSCGTASFTIANEATAGLYNYTPYTPNAAALNQPSGDGDLCSAYGNRDFFRLMKRWFPEVMATSGAPVYPSPASTVTPQLTNTYNEWAKVGSSVGSETGPMVCSDAYCGKPFTKGRIYSTSGWGRAVLDPLYGVYKSMGGGTSALGLPTADRTCSGGACTQSFEHGALVSVPSSPTEVTVALGSGLANKVFSDPSGTKMTTYVSDASGVLTVRVGGSGAGSVLAFVATGATCTRSFSDVPSDLQFAADIRWTACTGISTGWPDGTYRPVQPIERGAMMAFVYRMAGSPAFTAPSRPSFSDVGTGDQFYREIEWAKSVGLTTGYPDGTFRPTATTERGAMAAFLYRMAGSPATTASSTFSDVPAGSMFSTEIAWLASTDIATGYADGTYRPVDPVNRDAMAAFLHRWDARYTMP